MNTLCLGSAMHAGTADEVLTRDRRWTTQSRVDARDGPRRIPEVVAVEAQQRLARTCVVREFTGRNKAVYTSTTHAIINNLSDRQKKIK